MNNEIYESEVLTREEEIKWELMQMYYLGKDFQDLSDQKEEQMREYLNCYIDKNIDSIVLEKQLYGRGNKKKSFRLEIWYKFTDEELKFLRVNKDDLSSYGRNTEHIKEIIFKELENKLRIIFK